MTYKVSKKNPRFADNRIELVTMFAFCPDSCGMHRKRRLPAGFVKAQKKLIVVPTTNLTLTLKSNTMKNSLQNYKIFLKHAIQHQKIFGF